MGIREEFIRMVEQREKSLRDEGWEIVEKKIGWRMAVLTLRRTSVEKRVEKKIALVIPYEVYAHNVPFTELREVEV